MLNIVESNLKFDGLRKRETTDFLIFHHAEAINCTVEDIHAWHKERGWIGCGYNLVVYKDGSIHSGRPMWACDADAYGYNDNSISACFVGNFDVENMTEEQVQTGIDILRDTLLQYPKIRALRHKDVNNTSCPGQNFRDDIIYEGMKPVIATVDPNFKRCVDMVAADIGLNSPEFWYKAQYDPVVFMRGLRAEYVVRLLEMMANKIYETRGV